MGVSIIVSENTGRYPIFGKPVVAFNFTDHLCTRVNQTHGKKGKYRMGTLDMHGSKDVVDLVEKTPCAIGYSGLAYATDHIKMACVSQETGDKCVSPTVETASERSYPIARPLFMYTNGEPTGEVKKYLDWILSDEGQCIIQGKGYAPVRNITCK